MFLQELMNLVVVTKLSTTSLKVLDPVEACILNVWTKMFLYLTAFYVSCESARCVQATDISLEIGGHKLYTFVGYSPVRLLLIHPEVIVAPFSAEKEVTK